MTWALFKSENTERAPTPPLWQTCTVLCPWVLFRETTVCIGEIPNVLRVLHFYAFIEFVRGNIRMWVCGCVGMWGEEEEETALS